MTGGETELHGEEFVPLVRGYYNYQRRINDLIIVKRMIRGLVCLPRKGPVEGFREQFNKLSGVTEVDKFSST
jgi:hypothetical protein